MTEPDSTPRPLGPHPGGEPRANPAARWITVLLGILLLALAGVLARELWYLNQDQPYTSWVEPVLDFVGTTAIDVAAVTVGIIVSLIGLWLIVTSFLPRRHTHVRVNSPASIWVRPVDIARRATATTREETGAANISSKADRKRVTVQVQDDGTGTVEERAARALGSEFARLANPPAVAVKLLPQPAAASTAPAAQPATPAAQPAAYNQPEV